MGFYVRGGNDDDFEVAPQGTHPARCVQVIDLGTQYSQFYDKWSPKIRVGYELTAERKQDGAPFIVFKQYTKSLHKNAALRVHLESWRGRAFSKQELEAFDLMNILGQPCLVSVSHNADGESTYANVTAVTAVPKGTTVPEPVSDLVVFNLEQFDRAVFESFSDNLKQKILSAKEMKTEEKITPQNTPQQPTYDDQIPF